MATLTPLDSAFRDCLGGRGCYSAEEGKAGVKTPQVNVTTTFRVQAVTSAAGDSLKIVGFMDCPVRVAVPWIDPATLACEKLPVPSGRVVRLRWIAHHTDGCSVFVNDDEVVTDAPANTYNDGFFLLLTQPPGKYDISVRPHSDEDTGALPFSPLVTITGSPPVIRLPGATATSRVVSLSASAAGNAVAALYDPAAGTSGIAIIDIAARAAIPAAQDISPALDFSLWGTWKWPPRPLAAAAMSPDGLTCWAWTYPVPPAGEQASFYNCRVDARTGRSVQLIKAFPGARPPFAPFPVSVANGAGTYLLVMPGETYVLLVASDEQDLDYSFNCSFNRPDGTMVDRPMENWVGNISDVAYASGASGDPAGSTWFLSAPDAQRVFPVIAKPAASFQASVPHAIEVPPMPAGIGMTADGMQALVACQSGYVSVIDVPTLTQVDTIQVPGAVYDVAVRRDGSYAFAVAAATDTDPEAVYVIDLKSRSVPYRFTVPGGTLGPVAVTADGGLLIAAGGSVLAL